MPITIITLPEWAAAWRLVRQAMAALERGQVDEADALVGDALARVPDHWGAWGVKATIQGRERGRLGAALAALDRALAGAPSLSKPRLFSARGQVLFALGRYAEALTVFDVLRLRSPGEETPWVYRAQCLWRLGRREEAFAACEEGVPRLPGAPRLRALDAALQLRLGRPAEALAACDRLLGPDAPVAPDAVRADAWHTKAVALAALGRPDEALAAADEALRGVPEWGAACAIRARALAALGRAEEARAEAERALALVEREAERRRERLGDQPEDPVVEQVEWAARRDALRALGRDAEADEAAERARALGW